MRFSKLAMPILLTTVLSGGAVISTTTPAQARPCASCDEGGGGGSGGGGNSNPKYTVTEKEGYVNTGIHLNAGEHVQISATTDQIYAGVWLTGSNGPMGWDRIAGGSQFPAPNERSYSLLAQIGNDHYYVGAGALLTAKKPGNVVLKINDDVLGNGSGYFRADAKKVG